MEKFSRQFLYFFLGIIILGGLALFIFRSALVGYLQEQSGLNTAAPTNGLVKKETLNTDILKDPSFTALRNNVVNFHFDRICSQPVTAPSAVVVSSPTDTSTTTVTTTAPVGCVLGSGAPFNIPVPKK